MSFSRSLTLLVLTIVAVGFAASASHTAAVPNAFVGESPGFPVTLPNNGRAVIFGSPTLSDINLDGKPEIIIGNRDGFITAIKFDGTVLWQFNAAAAINAAGVANPSATSAIRSAPAVADLDGDGSLEIIVACGDVFSTHENGGVVVLRANGTLFPGWPRLTVDKGGGGSDLGSPDGYTDGVVSSPVIADFTGDGVPEIAYGAFDSNIYMKRIDGTDLPGWPRFIRDTVWSSPAAADLDKDGVKEMIIGVDAHLEPAFNTQDGGYVHVFRANGTELPGWPQFQDDIVMSSPAIADLDKDGSLDVVVGAGDYYARLRGTATGRRVVAFRKDGTVLWQYIAANAVATAPALGDLNGDGFVDVVFTDRNTTDTDGKVYALDGRNGTLLWPPRLPANVFGSGAPYPAATLGDYDGDGLDDIFTTIGGSVAVVKGTTGALLTGNTNPPTQPAFYTDAIMPSTPAVGDLNGDGKLELVAGSASANSGTVGQVHMWPLAFSTNKATWPMFHLGPRHNAALVPPVVTVVNPTTVTAVMKQGEQQVVPISITNSDGSALNWTVSKTDPNNIISLGSTSGTAAAPLQVTLKAPATQGQYTGSITISVSGRSPVTVPIKVYSLSTVYRLYGSQISR